MNKPIALIGAGGHAKVIIEIIEEMRHSIGFINDVENRDDLLGYPVRKELPPEGMPVVIAIGSNRIRKKIAEGSSATFATAVHPHAQLSSRACLGEGTVLMAGAVVNSQAVVGRHCIINTNASVDHDCLIGDYAHISPGAALAGNVTVGEGSQVGTGASVIPGVVIGKWAMIGAGAVVIENVPDYAVVVGVPGKVIKYNR